MNHSLNFSEKLSKTSCSTFKLVGCYLLIILISSSILNSINLWILHKAKLITSVNFFMIALFCLNIIATFLELPLLIYNSFTCRFIKLLES